MFRLRRHKSSASDNSGDKFGFVFSNIQALQVPKGWDNLCVSLISVEAAKTICKLEKASVNNGTCRWTESLWSPEDYASKDLNHFKFLVSMGSSRSGILGEATVNVGHYKNLEDSTPVSLPLKKCNKGTILNFEIKCLTPRTSIRFDTEEDNSICNGMDNKSEEMNHSLHSMEDSLDRDSLSSASNSSGVVYSAIGRLESTDSGGSAPWNSYSYDSPKSNNSPNKLSISSQGKHPQYTAEERGQCSPHITRTSLQDAVPSTNSPQHEDANIEELMAEAKMWELNARRLMIKLEALRKEFADQSQHIADMEMERSTSCTESNRLMQEIKNLEVLLEESTAKQIAAKSLNLQAKITDSIRKELEDELRFQRESNHNLSLQLMKSQESNIELVSVLQEMEETVQKQKMEIDNLLALKSRSDVMGVMNGCRDEDNAQPKSTEQVSVEKLCQQESHISLENSIVHLEKALKEKNHEIELERDLRAQDLFYCEEKWRSRTSSLEKDIANLQLKLSKPTTASEYEAFKHGSQFLPVEEEMVEEEKDMKKVKIEKEGDINSRREDTMVQTGSICAHIADKIQEMKLLELESEKEELESCVCELEKENVQLSERVSGLEAQLRHLTDAMELSRMELQHKGTHLSKLQDKIRELEKEKESQKLEMKHRLMDMEKRWLDAQEESEYLKKANPQLQATAESLIEECNSLQILNGELRRQRLEFKVKCNLLEAELRKYQHSFSNFLNRIESLEAKFSSILEEASSKENCMSSQLEEIILQDKEYKERLVLDESLRSQLCKQKHTELENPRQIFDPCDTEEKKPSKVFPEMHSLFVINNRLKLTLQEIQQNLEISEGKLVTTQMECERKVQDLMSELDAHKTKQEFLAVKCNKQQIWSENVISSEANLKCIIEDLESKLLLSESERLQLADANSSLKIELLKIAFLQDEVLALKGSLNDMKFKNERLEASLQLVCGENEELKAGKTSLIQELTGMQNSVAELEECRCRKIVLEEKVLRLEGDLTAREVMRAKDAELKNELGQSKRANSQLCWKIKQLEFERQYLLKEVYSLQEELKRKENSDKNAASKEPKLSEVEYSQCNDYETIRIPATECTSKSQLEDENTQFKSLQTEGQSAKYKKFKANENAVEYDHKISKLEAELTEISERYLHISLKYAEVENQKGKLQMTLKTLQDQSTRTSS